MKRVRLKFTLLAATLALGLNPAGAQSWKVLTTGIDTNLRGISAAKISATEHIAIWACGSHGVILHSLDDGASWSRVDIPGQPDLDFRGIIAFNEGTAYLMASGEGEKSRIYKTTSGGASWELQYTDVNNSFFLDSIACVSETKCFALGDPLKGKFLLLQTTDGHRWNPMPPQDLPSALPKEGAFAASNSNLLTTSEDELWVITGGFAARVLHTSDGGKSWSASAVPIAADNASSGGFSIARSGENQFVTVGGDYSNPAIALRIAATSSDNTKSWQTAAQQPSGYRSAVVSLGAHSFLAVGPTGADLSDDSGQHWTPFPSLPLNALLVFDANHVYGAGPKGTIAQFASKSPE